MASNRPFRLPSDATLAGTLAGDESEALRAELTAASDRARAANADRERAKADLNAAPAKDAADYAVALRAGRKDPGPVHAREAAAVLSEVERRAAGEQSVMAAIRADLIALKERRGVDWRSDVEARLADARAASRDAFAVLREAITEVDRLRAAEAWVRSGETHATPMTRVPGLLNSAQQPLTLPVVLRALEEALAEPLEVLVDEEE
ncbi:MAG: hypothetical protein ACOYBP_09220 [Microbacteriaceae bacterium]